MRKDLIRSENSEVQRVERMDLQRRGEAQIFVVREMTREVSSLSVVNDDGEMGRGEVVTLKQDLSSVGRWGEVG